MTLAARLGGWRRRTTTTSPLVHVERSLSLPPPAEAEQVEDGP